MVKGNLILYLTGAEPVCFLLEFIGFHTFYFLHDIKSKTKQRTEKGKKKSVVH